MSALRVFLVLLYFFAVSLIVFLAWLLPYFCCGSLFFSLESLFSSLLSQVLLGFWRRSSLLFWVLFDFWRGSSPLAWVLLCLFEDFLIFAFSSLDVLFLLDGPCSSGIWTPSNIGFSLKSRSVVVALKMMFLKISTSLTLMFCFGLRYETCRWYGPQIRLASFWGHKFTILRILSVVFLLTGIRIRWNQGCGGVWHLVRSDSTSVWDWCYL